MMGENAIKVRLVKRNTKLQFVVNSLAGVGHIDPTQPIISNTGIFFCRIWALSNIDKVRTFPIWKCFSELSDTLHCT